MIPSETRDKVMDIAKRRGFFWPSFEIYGGMRGFYDYGPLGSALKENILNIMKKYYILREGFALLDGTNIGPEAVFVASGHVAEFSDLMVKCKKCGESFKAEEFIPPEIDPHDASAVGEYISENGIHCPLCGGDFSEPEAFNLMFRTSIGPGSGRVGYLRPETAQNIFVNFPVFYRYFRQKLPLGIVQVGKGFRNEISPRQGLLRMREFNMLEVEVFFDPEDTSWPRFSDVSADELYVVDKHDAEHFLTVSEIMENDIVKDEALVYFMAITRRMLLDMGIKDEYLRFRQHKDNELAHYSSDCWDCEVMMSTGWVEVVGIANRGSYDLSKHMKHSGKDMSIARNSEVKRRRIYRPDWGALGPRFGKFTARIRDALENGEYAESKDGLVIDDVTVPAEMFKIEEVEEKERFVPLVIEPSYGVDRILYAVVEHSYSTRKDTGYNVMALKPEVAPIKVAVFPLMSKDGLDDTARNVLDTLVLGGIASLYDDSGSIGRRYARADEIGIPYAITVDYDTIEDSTVTLRERDSTDQIRIRIDSVVSVVMELLSGAREFKDYVREETS